MYPEQRWKIGGGGKDKTRDTTRETNRHRQIDRQTSSDIERDNDPCHPLTVSK